MNREKSGFSERKRRGKEEFEELKKDFEMLKENFRQRENMHNEIKEEIIAQKNELEKVEHRVEMIERNLGCKDQKLVRLVVVGYGNRGSCYSRYAIENPGLCKVVAICEPRRKRVGIDQHELGVKDENIFSDWRDFLEKVEGKIADAVLICTQDRDHVEPALAFANKGYHILLEKPMAQTLGECEEIVRAVKKNQVILSVCHVMRYSQPSQCVKRLLKKKTIGKILNIQHIEPVGFSHFAHSYVRGNWCKESDSNFVLLTKCCHDLDLLCYFMEDVLDDDSKENSTSSSSSSSNRVISVTSFGTLSHFRKEDKPKEVPSEVKRCVDCPIERDCPYSAVNIYQRQFGPFCRDLMKDGSVPTLTKVIEELHGDNRYGKIIVEGNNVYHKDFVTMKVNKVVNDINGKILSKKKTTTTTTSLTGHGFADYFLMKTFVEAVGKDRPDLIFSDEISTLRSHKLVFRAEQSRKENRVLNLDENYDII